MDSEKHGNKNRKIVKTRIKEEEEKLPAFSFHAA